MYSKFIFLQQQVAVVPACEFNPPLLSLEVTSHLSGSLDVILWKPKISSNLVIFAKLTPLNAVLTPLNAVLTPLNAA